MLPDTTWPLSRTLLPILLVSLELGAAAQEKAFVRVGEFGVGEGGNVRHVSFSGDGHAVAAASEAGEVLAWDVATGEIRARFAVAEPLQALAASPDGALVATVDSELRVTSVCDGACVHRCAARGGSTVAWSTDGTLLAAHLGGSSLVLFDARTFTIRDTLALESQRQVLQMRFDAGDRRLAVLQWRDGAFLVDVASGERRVLARGDFSGLVGFDDGRWGVTHTDRTAPAPAPGILVLDRAHRVAWCPRTGEALVLAIGLGRGCAWLDAAGRAVCQLPRTEAAAVHAGAGLAALAREGRVELRDRGGHLVRTLHGFRRTPAHVAVSHDGTRVLAVPGWQPHAPAGELHQFDVSSGRTEEVRTKQRIRGLRSVPGRAEILLVGSDRLQLWQPSARQVAQDLGPASLPLAAVWSPNGRLLWADWPVTMRAGGETQEVLDLVRGSTTRVPTPGGSQPLAWSHDNARLLLERPWPNSFGTGTTDLRLLVEGEATASAKLAVPASSAAWSESGDLVAVATPFATLVLDGASLVEVARGPASAWVRFVDAAHVVTSSENEVVVWHAPTGDRVCAATLRPGLPRERAWRAPGRTLPPGDAAPLGRTIAVADALGVHVFRLVR